MKLRLGQGAVARICRQAFRGGLSVLLLIGAVSIIPCANAQPTWFYLRGDLGASISRDLDGGLGGDAGTATLIQGGVGFKILPFIRTDLTVGYRTGYEVDTTLPGVGASVQGDVNVLTGMLNAYFDLPEYGRLQPYIGGGVGIAYADVDSLSGPGVELAGDETTNFVWRVGGGLAISLVPGVALDLAYHYADFGEIETRGSGSIAGTSSELTAHELTAGIRVGF